MYLALEAHDLGLQGGGAGLLLCHCGVMARVLQRGQ